MEQKISVRMKKVFSLRNIRVVGWICMGLSIPNLLTSIWLSETSAGTALLGSGIALLVIGIIMFGWAMKGAEAP